MAYKKYTQPIFDDMEDGGKRRFYGDLSLMYQIFTALTDTRRFKRHMSQHDLATKCGMPQSSIARIEAGRANPTLSQLIKICRGLNLKIAFEENEYGPPPEDMD